FIEHLHGLIGQGGLTAVRGRGLLIGMDFISPEATRRFVQRCFAAGVILGWTLHRDTVVRLAPPLTISSAEIAHAVAVIRDALTAS
ncbi:MAG: aminotransferase class III-fold pyridoxal phosphate-dependent enzyme, partial [Candidatus Binatia bacterium]|nr:aminotransferase class III-fold pyridoxal phosphate-dependent enzyme [Candidatus Binatia bacterium]